MATDRIVFHYWCGKSWASQKQVKYVKYLLISIESLIRTANVKPENIYVSIDPDYANTVYGRAVRSLGVHIANTPKFQNHGKILCFSRLLQSDSTIDKLVQIDCDMHVNYPEALKDLERIKSPLAIKRSPRASSLFINERDGQSFQNIFSVSKQQSESKYEAFRCFTEEYLKVDVDDLIAEAGKVNNFFGYLYVLQPKLLPEGFLRFLRFFNYFFEDDEMTLVFATQHFGLDVEELSKVVNSPTETQLNSLEFSAFFEHSGFCHFPPKDDALTDFTTEKADKLVSQLLSIK